MAKIIIYFILICLSLYVLLGVLLYFNTDRFLYHPNGEDFYECDGFENFSRGEFNGTRFYFNFEEESDKILVYYHGNGGTACDRTYLAQRFKRFGINLLFVEYSGYANDTRKPSKELLLNDAVNMKKYLDYTNHTNIVVLGESLGTAIALHHSYVDDNVYSVVILAGFDSIKNIAENRYLKYYPVSLYDYDNYDNMNYLQNYSGKLIMIHGTLDENIPIQNARNLYETATTKDKKFEEYNYAKHDDLFRYYYTYQLIREGITK